MNESYHAVEAANRIWSEKQSNQDEPIWNYRNDDYRDLELRIRDAEEMVRADRSMISTVHSIATASFIDIYGNVKDETDIFG